MTSPSLPSPSTLDVQPTNAKAGSRRAPVPVDAPTGFLSAMNLVTKDQLHQDYTPQTREPSKPPSPQEIAYQDPDQDAKPAPKRRRPRKVVAPVAEDADGEAPAPVKRGRKKATVHQEEVLADAAAAAPAPERPRRKAAKADAVHDGPEGADDGVGVVAKPKKPPPRPRAPRKTKAVLQAEATERDAQSAFQPWQLPTEPGDPSEPMAATVTRTSDIAVPAAEKVKKPVKTRVRKAKAVAEADTAVETSASELASDSLTRNDNTVKTAKPVEAIDPKRVLQQKRQSTPPPANLAYIHDPNVYENNDNDAHSPVSVDVGITGNSPEIGTYGHWAATDDVEVTEGSPKPLGFADLMGDFGHQQEEAGLPIQRADGEPATKRRRIEPVAAKSKPKPDTVSNKKESKKEPKKEPKKKAEPKPKKPKEPKPAKEPKPPKEPKKKAEPKPKKPRAPPKKPLTITALATAAYRPQVLQPESANAATLTSYFQVEPGQEEQAGVTSAQATLAPTKRKSAKPPAKLNKKAQTALVAAQYRLESPETAHRNMRNQDWLFGTSSQLAAAESPTEYRDLQRAIKESEEFVGSQDMEGSQALEAFFPASRMRVPSAPHGTDLSIGQAHRDLWLSAARDFEKNTFACHEELGIIMEEGEAAFPRMAVPELPTLSSERPLVQGEEISDSGYVDIDDISRIVSDNQTGLAPVDRAARGVVRDGLRKPAEAGSAHSIPITEAEAVFERTILKRLDPNAGMSKPHVDVDSKPSSPIKPPISSHATEPISLLSSPTKAPRRRPRKVAIDVSSPPKRRGRPPKSLQPFSDPTAPGPDRALLTEHTATHPQPQNVESSPYLDIDDVVAKAPSNSARPLSNTQPAKQIAPESSPYRDIDDLALSSPERPLIHRHMASRPAPHSSPYLDIDDISDVEAASAPPSPPRPTKGKTPAIQNTLELSNPAAVPPVKPRSDKQLQTDFATISPSLFPKITAVVKGTPRTKDPKHPSWREKMLLYDPIVLEDFTAWLTAQGVRIESERERVVVVKPKKGRKRKNAEADEEAVEEQTVVEKEILREELRCWMVQKWCEENSVCCLWKEGMRGGVRQKY